MRIGSCQGNKPVARRRVCTALKSPLQESQAYQLPQHRVHRHGCVAFTDPRSLFTLEMLGIRITVFITAAGLAMIGALPNPKQLMSLKCTAQVNQLVGHLALPGDI